MIAINLSGKTAIVTGASQGLGHATSMSDGGRIVNMASISAVVGFFGPSKYAAAKAGVIALTKVLSKELAGQTLHVNGGWLG